MCRLVFGACGHARSGLQPGPQAQLPLPSPRAGLLPPPPPNTFNFHILLSWQPHSPGQRGAGEGRENNGRSVRDCERELGWSRSVWGSPFCPAQALFSCRGYQCFLLPPTIPPHSWALFHLLYRPHIQVGGLAGGGRGEPGLSIHTAVCKGGRGRGSPLPPTPAFGSGLILLWATGGLVPSRFGGALQRRGAGSGDENQLGALGSSAGPQGWGEGVNPCKGHVGHRETEACHG